MTRESRSAWRWLLRLVGPCLLAWILLRMDMRAIVREMARVNPWLYAGAVALSVAPQLLRALRWRALALANPGATLSVGRAYAYHMAALFLGSATPGRLGELYKIGYLRPHGLSTGAAAAVVLADRAMDLAFPLLLSVTGLLLYSELIGAAALPLSAWSVGLIALALGGALILLSRRRLWGWIAMRVRRLGVAGRHLEAFSSDFRVSIRRIRAGRWTTCAALTCAAWAAYCAQLLLIAWSLGMAAQPLYYSFAFVAVAVVAALPISVVGVGTRDATLVWLLGAARDSPEQAISLSTLILLLMLLNAAAGWIVFLIIPQPVLPQKENGAQSEQRDRHHAVQA